MDFAAAQTPWDRERDAVVGRMMAGGGGPGLADPGLLSGKTGLELLQAILRGERRRQRQRGDHGHAYRKHKTKW